MTDVNQEDVHRMLGLTVQILEDLPEWLQRRSNMDDMRAILAGDNTGRDGLIITQAVATALAYRTQHAMAHALAANEAGINNRLQELRSRFQLVQCCDAWLFAISYNEACDRIARAGEKHIQ